MNSLRLCGVLIAGAVFMPWFISMANAGEIRSCYETIKTAPPAKAGPVRALYVFIDSTTPFTVAAKNKVRTLVGNWGRGGDVVKIARFSAGIRGKYPELLFAESLETTPDDTYLYNLRAIDKHNLLECLETQKTRFVQAMNDRLNVALNEADAETPRTEIFFALRDLAQQVILTTDAPVRNALIVTDGLENSAMVSFYQKRTIRKIDISKTIKLIRKNGLIANWKGTNIYMYGLGLMPKDGTYTKAATLENLRNFWERYFVEGNAAIRGLGAPDLFYTTIE